MNSLQPHKIKILNTVAGQKIESAKKIVTKANYFQVSTKNMKFINYLSNEMCKHYNIHTKMLQKIEK